MISVSPPYIVNTRHDPLMWDDSDSCHVIDLGAPVLGFHNADGVLMVTTTRGTFPLDPRFFDEAPT